MTHKVNIKFVKPSNKEYHLDIQEQGKPCMKTTKLTLAKQTTNTDKDTFSLAEENTASLKNGYIRIKVSLISIEPAMSGWIVNRTNYMPKLAIGDTMHAFAIGEVIESRHVEFKVGDRVNGNLGCQTIADINPNVTQLDKSIPRYISDDLALSACGLTGLTAYFGLEKIGKLKSTDIVVISAAAGAVGSMAGQFAKMQGCKVIGIVGSNEKMALIQNEFGYDIALNYKDPDFKQQFKDATPKGIDVYYDNVGGPILNYSLARINKNARVILCGGIAHYNSDSPMTGPSHYFNLVHQRALMQGFIVLDYEQEFNQAREKIASYIEQGRLSYRTEVFEGLAKIPEALQHMFKGKNKGKVLVKL
ncbi:MAG: NADP-dependent oxidoreductase [Colwellia sp.]|nr:NADP-dependent oxidoreductase [Colwellia sp.]